MFLVFLGISPENLTRSPGKIPKNTLITLLYTRGMKIIGHRGARGLAPENTIVGLQKGLQHHVDMLEFDLRVTHDGIVVLHHNPFITDPNGEKQVIKNTGYDELRAHKPDLATFEEVLTQITPNAVLYIEVKPAVPIHAIIRLIQQHLKSGWKADHLFLASFDYNVLRKLREALPEIAIIVLEKWSGVRATHRARQLGTRYLCINQRWLWSGFIRPMAKRGWKLMTYTLNDPAKAKRWASYGLYGVVTDYPDRFES